MSFSLNLRPLNLLKNARKQVILISSASYSRDSRRGESPYKYVRRNRSKFDLNDVDFSECSNNWELFNPRGNRFFLPNRAGPAWLSSNTIIPASNLDLENLIDFESENQKKLHVSTKRCPVLLRKNLHEIFPAPEVITENHNLTLITLTSNQSFDDEQAAKNFVLAAKEICSRLRNHGYFADFMNPFSGKPFFSYASGKNLYKIDERFRGLYMKLEHLHDCVLITSDEKTIFSGSIYSNVTPDLPLIKSLVLED